MLGPILLSETAPLDSEAPERSDEEPTLSRCYPSTKQPEQERRPLWVDGEATDPRRTGQRLVASSTDPARGLPRSEQACADPRQGDMLAAAECLRHVDRPALLIWAKEDRVMPLSHGWCLADLLPHGRLIELADSYTLMPLDQQGELAHAIRQFIPDARSLHCPFGRCRPPPHMLHSLVLHSLKAVTEETPTVPRGLRRASPDPGLGPQVELSGRDARGLLDLFGIGKTLSSQGITAEEPPPTLL